MDAPTVLAWAQVVFSGIITVILIPLAIYFVRYYWDRRRWRAFERLVRVWTEEKYRLPEDLKDEDWNAMVVTMLCDAGFEPARVKDLVELAVWFAKGLTSLAVRGRI